MNDEDESDAQIPKSLEELQAIFSSGSVADSLTALARLGRLYGPKPGDKQVDGCSFRWQPGGDSSLFRAHWRNVGADESLAVLVFPPESEDDSWQVALATYAQGDSLKMTQLVQPIRGDDAEECAFKLAARLAGEC